MEKCYNYVYSRNGESTAVGTRLIAVLSEGAGSIQITDFEGNKIMDKFPLSPGYNPMHLMFRTVSGTHVTLNGTNGYILI